MTKVFEAQTTVDQWDSDYYQPLSLQLYDRAITDMIEAMGVKAGDRVLDAGCGPGVHSIRVARAGHRVCAIDFSTTMLKQARQRVGAAGLDGKVEFLQKDLTRLDFDDASFRHVFSWGVIIHIPEAEKALDELARIVAPGGKLALYLTNKRALDYKVEGLMRFVLLRPLFGLEHRSLGDSVWYEMEGERLWVWRFDTDAVCEYLAARGFRLTHRRTGEFSEIQRRVRGSLRNGLLRLNNLAYRLRLPPRAALGQLLIFEKT